MPAFTAIGIAVAEAIIGGGFASVAAAMTAGAFGFAAVATVVGMGAAFVTSRLINGSQGGGGGGGQAQDPGIRVQLPPATANKIPIVYGSANSKGVVTDARLSSSDGVTNDTMTYVLTLSEKTQTGSFTIGDIFWNDSLLVFDTAGGNEHIVKSSIDQSGNGTTSTNYNGLIKVRVYAGNATTSTSQIFPTTNKVTAISMLGETSSTYLLSDLVYAVVQIKYDSQKGVTGLSDMTYQIENSLKNPGLVWYDYITSSRYGAGIDAAEVDTDSSISTASSTSLYSISNQIPPYQYDTSQGAEFNATITIHDYNTGTMVVSSIASGTIQAGQSVEGATITGPYHHISVLSQYSGTPGGVGTYQVKDTYTGPIPTIWPLPDFVFTGTFNTYVESTQVRYQINGVLSPGDTVKNNLDRISQNSAAWTTYDYVNGLWKVIPNRALTSLELADTLIFDDDSIIGEVSINATNIEDLYNSLEVEFCNKTQRDQNDYYRAAIVAEDRNPLEPDNTLSMRLDLVNNAIHAGRLGQIELLQSRRDLLISFRTDFTGLQVEAGDVIRITNEVYGFSEKPFRVTRTKEVEGDDGSLMAELTAIEYSADVYTDIPLSDYEPTTGSGIPSYGGSSSLPAPSAPTLSASNPSANQPNFTISTTIATGSQLVDTVEWWYSNSAGGTYSYLQNEHGSYPSASVVSDIIYSLGAGTWYFKARTSAGGIYSDYSSASSSFSWNPTPGGVSSGTISTSTFSSQIQIVNTTSGALKIPLVATTSGFQPVYADTDLSYDAASNLLSAGGLALSTGTTVQKVVSSGGFPLNSAGTASIFLNAASPSAIVSNYSGGTNPFIVLRGYGQNRVGGISTTQGNPGLYVESSRGTNTSPTAVVSGDSLGGLVFMGYDGNNWPSAQNITSYNFMGFYATETMTYDATTATITNAAGSGFNLFLQPGWTKPGTSGNTRQRSIFTSWTTSTTAPSQLNLLMGSGLDGAASTQTLTLLNGNTYFGPGRSNISFLNSAFSIIGVPQQDTAPDNSTLTATNAINFVSGRRSAVSGRRNIIQANDTLGIINFSGQTSDSSTGVGSQAASITVSAIETFGASARGGQISLRTVNSGTTTISNRLDLNDRQNAHNSDSHLFRDKTGSFTALTVTTATTTVSGTLNAPGTYHVEVGRQSSDQAITGGANTDIQFNKITSDPQGWYNSGNYRITPTVSGYYLVQLQVSWTKSSVFNQQQNIQIQKNGSTAALSQCPVYISTATSNLTQSTFGIVQLNGSTDYVTGTVYTDGTGQSLIAAADGAWTKITLTKLQ